jgi:hypothetical protein
MLKTVSSIVNAIGALNYKGTWNASTNTPTLASGVGTKGDYYQVSVAGSTSIDGISNWGVGDVIAFNGTTWQRIEGGADLNGVNLSVSGVASFAAGNAAAPSQTPSGDQNTGVFYPSADTIAEATNGVERRRVTSTGRHGFNTSSPDQTVHVEGSIAVNGTTTTASGMCVLTGTFANIANGQSLQIDLDFNTADGTYMVEVFAKALNNANGNNAEMYAMVKGSKIGGTFYDSAVSPLYAARFSTPTITNVAGTERIQILIANNDGQTFNSHQAYMLRIFGTDQAVINSVTIV